MELIKMVEKMFYRIFSRIYADMKVEINFREKYKKSLINN